MIGVFRKPPHHWIGQRDRRNALLVASAANDLAVPLLAPEHQRAIYANSAYRDRRLVPAQRTYFDPSLLTFVAPDIPSANRAAPFVDRRLVPQQRSYVSDPTLLDTQVAMPAPNPPRVASSRDYGEAQWLQRAGRDPSLLATALLENELLGGAETTKRTNVPATHAPRWWAPQQPGREGFSPGLLDSAQLESPLLLGQRFTFTDRRQVPQQRPYLSDPILLGTTQLEIPPPRSAQIYIDRRVTSAPPRSFDLSLLAPVGDDPLLFAIGVGGDIWRRVNTPATHANRRVVIQPRRAPYPDVAVDAPLFVLTWASYWHRYNQAAELYSRAWAPQLRLVYTELVLGAGVGPALITYTTAEALGTDTAIRPQTTVAPVQALGTDSTLEALTTRTDIAPEVT